MAPPFSFLSRRRSQPATVKQHLFKLVLIALTPLIIFSAWIILLFSQQEKESLERGILETTRALAFAVDQELESSITVLQALAVSEHLDTGNITDFQRACERILQANVNWSALNLLDTSGRQLFHIAKPPGEPRPGMVEPESLNQALQTGRPAISNLIAIVSGGAIVNVNVPVWRENEMKYVLSVEIASKVFKEILTRQKISPDWLGTVLDRKQLIVADTSDQEQFVGKPGGPLSEKLSPGPVQGLLEGTTREGIPSYAAFNSSLLSGWSVLLAVPNSTISAPLLRSLLAVAGGGIFFLLVGIFLASRFARRISEPIRSLAAAATALARGEKVFPPPTSHVAEVEVLAQNIKRTADLLRDRSDERDRIEEALREREEFLQRHVDLLDLSADAIFAWEFGGSIIYWNQGAEQLFGYSRSEATGQASHDLLCTVFPETRKDFEATLIHGGEWTVELRHTTRHGRHVFVESRLRMITDRAGRRVVLECNRDITNRKRAEQRLSTEHAVTRILAESDTQADATGKILEAIGQGLGWEFGALWLVDRDADALRCADIWHLPSKVYPEFEAICRQRTFSSGVGLPGRVWAGKEPVWVPDIGKDSNFPRAPIAAKEHLRGAFAFPLKLGREVLGVVEYFNHEIREPDLDLINMTVIIGNEIGQFMERKRIEDRVRESEHRYRQLVHALPCAIYTCDAQGHVTLYNEAAVALWGREPEVDKDLWCGSWRIYQRDGSPVPLDQSPMAVTIREGRSVRGEEIEIERPDGSRSWVLPYPDPIRDAAGEVVGAINMFVDLTERKHAEQALLESEKKLRQQAYELEQQLIASGRLVSLGELTASMAHEFNNPLGTILGFAQNMLSELDPSDPNYRFLKIIDEEGKRCEKIVQDLLEFARPREADFIATDVGEVINKTIDMVASRVYKQKVEAVSEIEAKMPQIHADPQQLQQVLANLCLNALDAMPEGGKLTLSAAANSSNQIIITVADTGFGMDSETAAKIFQPFFTFGKRKGMGLGLPICDRIVKSHGGTIDMESRPGQGTTFRILLPINKSAAAQPNTKSVSPPNLRQTG
jgi:PAS domain S-box-containing protein